MRRGCNGNDKEQLKQRQYWVGRPNSTSMLVLTDHASITGLDAARQRLTTPAARISGVHTLHSQCSRDAIAAAVLSDR